MTKPASIARPTPSTWLDALVLQLKQRARAGDRMAELVLELGDVELAVPRPAGMRRGRRGYCFANAERRACRIDEEQTRYLYFEGYALNGGGFPIHHAWVSDGHGAIEVTWPEQGLAYIGVRFGCRERAILFRQYRDDAILPRLTVAAMGALWDRGRLPAAKPR